MPPSLLTTSPVSPAHAAKQAGWLLPAGILFVLLMLGRWSQQPASWLPTVAHQPAAPRVALSGPTHLPGARPTAAL